MPVKFLPSLAARRDCVEMELQYCLSQIALIAAVANHRCCPSPRDHRQRLARMCAQICWQVMRCCLQGSDWATLPQSLHACIAEVGVIDHVVGPQAQPRQLLFFLSACSSSQQSLLNSLQEQRCRQHQHPIAVVKH